MKKVAGDRPAVRSRVRAKSRRTHVSTVAVVRVSKEEDSSLIGGVRWRRACRAIAAAKGLDATDLRIDTASGVGAPDKRSTGTSQSRGQRLSAYRAGRQELLAATAQLGALGRLP